MTFLPSTSRTITGSITVTSDGIGSPQTLNGTGFVAVAGLSIAPGSLGGTNPGDFLIDADGCTGVPSRQARIAS